MKSIRPIVLLLLAPLVVAGCATTKIENNEIYPSDHISRPGHIWVYDFAIDREDLPSYFTLCKQKDSEYGYPMSLRQVEIGRQIGAAIADNLITQIRGMGMPAELGSDTTKLQLDDMVIRGCILSVNAGSAMKRITVGFGSGAPELGVVVKDFQVTPQGMRELGSRSVSSDGNKTPGTGLGAVALLATGNPIGLIINGGLKIYGEATGSATVEGRAKQTANEIASQFKIRFQQLGWISADQVTLQGDGPNTAGVNPISERS